MARRRSSVSALGLSAFMAAAGAMHFVSPEPYEQIVPPALGHERFLVASSGLAEIVVAILMANPRTRSVGGWLCAVLLVVVFPANVYAAQQGGYESVKPPFDSSTAAWVRLPLQIVLVWWAIRVARSGEGRRHEAVPTK